MAEYTGLKYKLAGEGTPQGCPRVYFMCHPDDFYTYFDDICEEIFAIRRNIAFFYLEDRRDNMTDETKKEAFLQDLAGMQLFVVPVTSKFLHDDKYNRALELEFKFAMEKHIPILPLMQEPGLETDFNVICGDLQMLDKNSVDETAIPYEEKLKKFIESILAGDELVNKIRAAFEAYIFLSYRKKDRAFAQQIMHLIHENPEYRDVAIWYDEFLTPGENFTESIKSAIEKSNLFALVVTPNLLEDKNYVMQIEFPMAKEKGKDILPLQAVPTDGKDFREKFNGAPEVVDPKDKAALVAKITDSAMAIALTEPKNNPQHLFFIGLAYLAGIDLEVDRAKGLELITEAAEAGLPEAYDKLVTMYETGEGVERSYTTAVQWRRKYCDYLGKNCRETKKYGDWRKYLHELWKLGDAYYSLRMYEDAMKAYEEMQHVANVLVKNGKEKNIRQVTVTYTKMSNIASEMGNFEAANELLKKALEVRAAYIDSEDLTKLRDLAINYSKLASNENSLGHLEKAMEYVLKAIEVADKALEISPENGRFTRDMSGFYSKYATFLSKAGRNKEAEEYRNKALIILEEVCNGIEATDDDFRNLSVELNKVGDAERMSGNFEKSEKLLKKSLEIRQMLCDKLQSIGARQDLAVAYERLGNLDKTKGNFATALQYFGKERDILSDLLNAGRTVEALHSISVVQIKIGDIYSSDKRFDEACKEYLKALEYRTEMLTITNSLQARVDMGSVRTALGSVYFKMKKYEEAELHLKKAIAIREEIFAETGLISDRSNIATSYRMLGEVYQNRNEFGDMEKAKEYFLKTVQEREEIIKENDTANNRRDLGIAITSLGKFYYFGVKDLDEALTCFLRNVEVCKEVLDKVKGVDNVRDLAIAYRMLAMIYRDKGDKENARKYFEQAMFYREKNYKEHPSAMTKADYLLIMKQFRDFARNNKLLDVELDMQFRIDKLEAGK